MNTVRAISTNKVSIQPIYHSRWVKFSSHVYHIYAKFHLLGILINRSKYGFHIYSDPGSISNEFNEATSGEDDNNIRWSIRNWYEQIDKCPPLYTPVIIAGKTVCWMLVLTSKLNPLASTSVWERLSLLISGAILNSYFIIPAWISLLFHLLLSYFF